MEIISRKSHEFQTIWQPLFAAAKEVREGSAYAPFSRFLVGAAVETEDGQIFAGCNVENDSYGLTVCAERVALQNMVTKLGGKKIRRICVVLLGGHEKGGSPCGACRQVIWQFSFRDESVEVLTCDPDITKDARLFTIGELLPDGFCFEVPA